MAAQVQPEGLNFKPYMSPNPQRTPPTSGRTTMSTSSLGSTTTGGGTTRRSFLFNTATMSYNGNYEGDYTMFDNITKMTLNATPRQPKQRILEQLFDSDLNLNLELANRCNEPESDGSIESMNVETETKEERASGSENEQPVASQGKALKMFFGKHLWHEYKSKIFSQMQYERIDEFLVRIQEHSAYRKIRCGAKLLFSTFMLLMNYLIFNVIVKAFNKSYSAWHARNALRNSARNMLWCMTLAKYEDLRLFALIAVLSPFTFLIGVVGFIAVLYCHVKEWIYRITGYVRLHMMASETE